MNEIDPLRVKVGDVICSFSNPDTRAPDEACHCAIVVTVKTAAPNPEVKDRTLWVAAHDLRPGDAVRAFRDHEGEDCHCDRDFLVERN